MVWESGRERGEKGVRGAVGNGFFGGEERQKRVGEGAEKEG